MNQKLPDIPRWASDQIEKGLIRDKFVSKESDKERNLNSQEIRASLMMLRLESLRDFFQSIAASKEERKNTAYEISMYQTALIQLGQGNLVIDGVYQDSKRDTSQTARMIANFQARNGIKNDGIPGRNTAGKIVLALEAKIASLAEKDPSAPQSVPPPVISAAPVPGKIEEKALSGGVPTKGNPSGGISPEELGDIIAKKLTPKKAPGFVEGFMDRWDNKPAK